MEEQNFALSSETNNLKNDLNDFKNKTEILKNEVFKALKEKDLEEVSNSQLREKILELEKENNSFRTQVIQYQSMNENRYFLKSFSKKQEIKILKTKKLKIFKSKSESRQLYEILRLKKNEVSTAQSRLEELHQEMTKLLQSHTDLSSSNFLVQEKNSALEKELVKLSIEKNLIKDELDKILEASNSDKLLLKTKLEEINSLKEKYENYLKTSEQKLSN